MKLILKDSAGN